METPHLDTEQLKLALSKALESDATIKGIKTSLDDNTSKTNEVYKVLFVTNGKPSLLETIRGIGTKLESLEDERKQRASFRNQVLVYTISGVLVAVALAALAILWHSGGPGATTTTMQGKP